MRARANLTAIATATIIMLASAHAIATDDSYKVIVNPDNAVGEVDREFLRDAFLKKAVEWPDGHTIRPVDLGDGFGAHDRFVREVLRKTPSQLKSYWNQQIFSGKGVPPPTADSVASVVAFVLANPGAVGYVPIDASAGNAKVVKVR